MSPKTFLDVCLELRRCLEFSESLSCVLPSLSVILLQAYLHIYIIYIPLAKQKANKWVQTFS